MAHEHGYTLPELLVAATALIGVLAIMGAGIGLVARNQVRIADRSAQIQEGRAMIEQITRELREGSGVQLPTSSTGVSFLTYVRRQQCGASAPPPSAAAPAIQCRVSYACTAGTCMRTEALPDGSQPGPARTMVTGLRSTEVFSYFPATDPGYITVTLEYPSDGGQESITLSDGAALRNRATGGST